MPAIAILIPRRHYAPETSTDSSGGQHNFPPPGYNPEQARKPIPESQNQKSKHAAKPSKGLDASQSPAAASSTEPTTLPKTEAAEQQTLSELASEKAAQDNEAEKKIEKKKEADKKLTVWQKVKKEANHYWDGTKLLATEVRISFKLALKMGAGYELTRREHRQVC